MNIQDLAPSYLIDLLKSMTTESVYDLNPKYELESSGRGAFSVSAPIMWNSLLDHIRKSSKFERQFQISFKTSPFLASFLCMNSIYKVYLYFLTLCLNFAIVSL